MSLDDQEIVLHPEYYVRDLLHGKPAKSLFGDLLRRVCNAAGIKQTKLERLAREKYSKLIGKGYIDIEDELGSMDQTVISRVMNGKQPISYTQAYIWINVIKDHYASKEFKEVCRKKKLAVPDFAPLERSLWTLAGLASPEHIIEAYQATKDFNALPHVNEPDTGVDFAIIRRPLPVSEQVRGGTEQVRDACRKHERQI
jgi:hypothetical protein